MQIDGTSESFLTSTLGFDLLASASEEKVSRRGFKCTEGTSLSVESARQTPKIDERSALLKLRYTQRGATRCFANRFSSLRLGGARRATILSDESIGCQKTVESEQNRLQQQQQQQ